MKATIEQINIANWFINTIQKWIDSDNIESETLYRDLEKSVNTNFEDDNSLLKEDIYYTAQNLLNIIQNV